MVRAIGFVLMLAFSLTHFERPVYAGGEQKSEQAAPPPPPAKPVPKTRSFRVDDGRDEASPVPRPQSAPAPSNTGGDGARPDDTVGGLPGHSAAPPAKQP